MKSKYVKCIKIVHDPAEVRIFRTLSAFFRFIGIFACENLDDDEYGDEVDWVYRVRRGSEDGNISLGEKIRDVFQEMEELIGEENAEVMNLIWGEFERYDLMRGSYAIDYFSNSGEEYIYEQMEKAIGDFEGALRGLEALEKKRERAAVGNVYLWAAKSNCRRRINELCIIIWNAIDMKIYGTKSKKETDIIRERLRQHHYFSLDEVDEDILNILAVDSEFYSAYAIRGFIKEINGEDIEGTIDDFETAIEIIGKKSYTSYLQFRIGRNYEKMWSDSGREMGYYTKAAEVDRHNFRAIYKIASKESNINKAINWWKSLRDVLDMKMELPSLQTVECAYLYKAYRELGKIYKQQGDFEMVIDSLQKAEKIYDNKANEDEEKGFYPWMFGKDTVKKGNTEKKSWEIYKEAARKKLEIEKVYEGIVDASARGNFVEIYKEYSAYLD